MIRRLIDCTYLHGVARCLRGEADHFDDVTNFLRLVGEILVADRILFTADQLGPVYKPAVEAATLVGDAIANGELVQHFDMQWVNYSEVCERAAADVAQDIEYLPKATSGGALSPVFESLQSDPDGSLLHTLQLAVLSDRHDFPDPTLVPGNAARFVLTRPKVLNALRRTNVLNGFRDANDFIRLTAAVRAIIYSHVGRELKATYLPAVSRARLLPSCSGPFIKTVSPLMLDAVDTQKGSEKTLSLATAVDVVVRLSDGSPYDILRRAWQVRATTLPIRDLFGFDAPGDALSTNLTAHAMTQQISKEFQAILKGQAPPRLLDCVEMKFVMFAIPTMTVHPTKLQEWKDRKAARSRIASFAELIHKSDLFDAVPAYTALKRLSGLSA